jgi:predicted CXXCH cytochrome family protein
VAEGMGVRLIRPTRRSAPVLVFGLALVSRGLPGCCGRDAAIVPDEPPEYSAGEPADNSYCYACHVNYKKESMTVDHQPFGVGCETCHGMSDQHSADEDNLTPPDRMFAKGDVIPFCISCHATQTLVDQEDHEPILEGRADPDGTCTDCHGENHRLAARTRIWDKKTGTLISDDGVRMMYEDSPAASEK